MKILIISPIQSGIGGIAQHVQGLTKFLKKHGHEVEIISSENTFTIPIKGLKNPSFMISSFIKSKFKKNFDIIHAHNIPAALAMKNTTGKKIITIHGIFSKQIDLLHGKTTGYISKKFETDALTWADVVTVISAEAKEYYSKSNFIVEQIPNGIDVNSFTQKPDRRFDKQIIFAGRLSKEKGTEALIEIGKKLPEYIHLIIVGKGPEEEHIKNFVDKKKNFHYLGIQNHEKTISLIKGSDILLQPSLSEGISTTILEAMASKTTVITSNVGGNKELIRNQQSGILVEPLEYEKFSQNIIELMNSEPMREKLSKQAFKTVVHYDWSFVGRKYLDLYNKILEN